VAFLCFSVNGKNGHAGGVPDRREACLVNDRGKHDGLWRWMMDGEGGVCVSGDVQSYSEWGCGSGMTSTTRQTGWMLEEVEEDE